MLLDFVYVIPESVVGYEQGVLVPAVEHGSQDVGIILGPKQIKQKRSQNPS